MEFRATGLEQASARLTQKAQRVGGLTPAFRVFGAWLEKQTDDCFQYSRDFGGVPFKALAPSTIEHRVGAIKAARKTVGKTGILTAKAAALQIKMRAPGGIKPLVDTARARNSQHAVASPNKITWSAVGYLGPHMDGHGHPPKRNPTAFDKQGGRWTLAPRAFAELVRVVRRFISTGVAG